jgi:hypothetical protein
MCFDGDGRVYVAESVDYPNDLVEPRKTWQHRWRATTGS